MSDPLNNYLKRAVDYYNELRAKGMPLVEGADINQPVQNTPQVKHIKIDDPNLFLLLNSLLGQHTSEGKELERKYIEQEKRRRGKDNES